MLEKKKDPETVEDWLQVDLDVLQPAEDAPGKKRVCTARLEFIFYFF